MLIDHIKAIKGIDNVKLTVVWSKKEYFSEQTYPSVIVFIYPTWVSDITKNHRKIERIQKLLQAVIEGLKLENIVIIDQAGNLINNFEMEDKAKVASTSAINVIRMIRTTLDRVADKWEAGQDRTGDGEINCKDAAIWFYELYPNKSEVRIVGNSTTQMNHAFNYVLINDVWLEIEPQAFTLPQCKSYLMRDLWGEKYNSNHNKDFTDFYVEKFNL